MDGDQIARALQGFGAGYRGRGGELLASRALQEDIRVKKSEKLDANRRGAMLLDNRISLDHLKNGRVTEAIEHMKNRLPLIEQMGGDPSDTLERIQRLEAGDIDFVMNDAAMTDRAAVLGKELDPFPGQGEDTKNQFGGQEVFKDESGALFFGTSVRNPKTGGVDSVVSPVQGQGSPQGRLTMVDRTGLNAEERIQQKGREAAATARGAGSESRVQSAIDLGVDASQGAAIINRSLALLKEVETGGIDSVQMKAKQLFGIESADEAELSSNLGKAVLSQLKTIFGAQFTEQEGSRLERIEAGFGKSTKGNIRLLNQTKQIINRASKRGIKAAIDSGDYRSAADIQDALDFQLSDEGLSSQFVGDIPDEKVNIPNQTAGQVRFLGFEK